MLRGEGEAIVRVTDTGCGISAQERDAVQRRFYRSDKIRNTPGVGLGLNLVAAIVKLHGFKLTIFSGPGCRVEIVCPDGPEWTQVVQTSTRRGSIPEPLGTVVASS